MHTRCARAAARAKNSGQVRYRASLQPTYHARMARRVQHLWCSLCERSERADNRLDKQPTVVLSSIKTLHLYLIGPTAAHCLGTPGFVVFPRPPPPPPPIGGKRRKEPRSPVNCAPPHRSRDAYYFDQSPSHAVYSDQSPSRARGHESGWKFSWYSAGIQVVFDLLAARFYDVISTQKLVPGREFMCTP